MLNRYTLGVLLSLSVVGGAAALADEPQPVMPGDMTPGAMRSDMSTNMVNAQTAGEIRNRLVSTVNSALSRNQFDALAGNFVKADSDRISRDRDRDFARLNDKIDQFRQAFHNKYGQEFDLKAAALDNIAMSRGADKDTAVVSLVPFMASDSRTMTYVAPAAAMNHPAAPVIVPNDGRVVTTSTNNITTESPVFLSNPRNDDRHPSRVLITAVQRDGAIDNNVNAPASVVRNPDLQISAGDASTMYMPHVAVVSPSNDGTQRALGAGSTKEPAALTGAARNPMALSVAQITLHHEGEGDNGWRLDVPDTLGSRSLADSLSRHIQILIDNQAMWPADVNAAYRLIAGHTLAALYDTSTTPEMMPEK